MRSISPPMNINFFRTSTKILISKKIRSILDILFSRIKSLKWIKSNLNSLMRFYKIIFWDLLEIFFMFDSSSFFWIIFKSLWSVIWTWMSGLYQHFELYRILLIDLDFHLSFLEEFLMVFLLEESGDVISFDLDFFKLLMVFFKRIEVWFFKDSLRESFYLTLENVLGRSLIWVCFEGVF